MRLNLMSKRGLRHALTSLNFITAWTNHAVRAEPQTDKVGSAHAAHDSMNGIGLLQCSCARSRSTDCSRGDLNVRAQLRGLNSVPVWPVRDLRFRWYRPVVPPPLTACLSNPFFGLTRYLLLSCTVQHLRRIFRLIFHSNGMPSKVYQPDAAVQKASWITILDRYKIERTTIG